MAVNPNYDHGGFGPFHPFGSAGVTVEAPGATGSWGTGAGVEATPNVPPGFWENFWRSLTGRGQGVLGAQTDDKGQYHPEVTAGLMSQQFIVGLILYAVLLIGMAEFIRPGVVGETKDAVVDTGKKGAEVAAAA